MDHTIWYFFAFALGSTCTIRFGRVRHTATPRVTLGTSDWIGYICGKKTGSYPCHNPNSTKLNQYRPRWHDPPGPCPRSEMASKHKKKKQHWVVAFPGRRAAQHPIIRLHETSWPQVRIQTISDHDCFTAFSQNLSSVEGNELANCNPTWPIFISH